MYPLRSLHQQRTHKQISTPQRPFIDSSPPCPPLPPEAEINMAPAAVEHVAPGEEQVVFSRTAGVVASKVSYMGVLDDSNDWQVLDNPVRAECTGLGWSVRFGFWSWFCVYLLLGKCFSSAWSGLLLRHGARAGHVRSIFRCWFQSRFLCCLQSFFLFFFVLPSHSFPEFEGRLDTPGILPEHLNRGHTTRFLSLRPPIPILVQY